MLKETGVCQACGLNATPRGPINLLRRWQISFRNSTNYENTIAETQQSSCKFDLHVDTKLTLSLDIRYWILLVCQNFLYLNLNKLPQNLYFLVKVSSNHEMFDC